MAAPHPLARRIHDRVLGLLGTALVKTEMCETLGQLGRQDEIPATLLELRSALEETRRLWKPYRRALRWLRHPITIALLQSYARRRAVIR